MRRRKKERNLFIYLNGILHFSISETRLQFGEITTLLEGRGREMRMGKANICQDLRRSNCFFSSSLPLSRLKLPSFALTSHHRASILKLFSAILSAQLIPCKCLIMCQNLAIYLFSCLFTPR